METTSTHVGEQEDQPEVVVGAEEEDQSRDKGEDIEPPGNDSSPEPNGAKGDHEDRCHPDGVDAARPVHDFSGEAVDATAEHLLRAPGIRRDQARCNCRGDEDHAEKEQSAPEQHRREESVLQRTDSVPYHSYEPQERDSCERDEAEREQHRVSP